jgi:hypothetical protein
LQGAIEIRFAAEDVAGIASGITVIGEIPDAITTQFIEDPGNIPPLKGGLREQTVNRS